MQPVPRLPQRGRRPGAVVAGREASARKRSPPIPENTEQPKWEERPDGSRVRSTNGIRIVDRSARSDAPEPDPSPIEHLVTWREDGGRVIVLGLDVDCRPVSLTTMYDYL